MDLYLSLEVGPFIQKSYLDMIRSTFPYFFSTIHTLKQNLNVK